MKEDAKKTTKKTNYVKVPKENMSRWDRGAGCVKDPAPTRPYAKKKEGK